MLLSSSLWAFVGLALSLPGGALAAFNSGATNNVALYWGQNSANQASTQQRLSAYCSNTKFNVIPLAFMNVIKNPTTINFANAGDNCTVFAGTQLLSCPQMEADIKSCQSAGKTIILSIGGATYTEGGFTSSAEATTWANTIWAMFGPVQSGSTAKRPFGTAVIDGFDLDIEATSQNMVPFSQQLRSNMDAAASTKNFFLSVAPQCVFPDSANNEMLQAVRFDFVSVQFYNNWCGVNNYNPATASQTAFNFDVWDNWAKTASKNPSVKILLGIPGSPTAAGQGYVTGNQLAAVVSYSRQFTSFGGVMVWDMSQVFNNVGFLDSITSALSGSSPPPVSSTTAKPTTTTFVTSTTTGGGPAPTGTLVPQWGQCGGNGYTGSTRCQPPYTCHVLSEWWAQCE
ncbi:glycoside hydrolase family 18 protein [Bombardia bombarda]|uniref:chitinase n=1 Tax=Bombardia bombarda TaxID=252184 RepID=A0AA40CGT8_9PEZI|nr:glycoside hydrolase family 18 protein [Bombardia bombarda]